ncbi:MAG: hypothetical protein J7L38_00890 [Thermoproteales archaeon]|nr:hypothetical protein [Thermoproteales archaeon]RLE64175.1 MAG: hypothetical protein DRJ47_08270 [Thermoprotei archaeon]
MNYQEIIEKNLEWIKGLKNLEEARRKVKEDLGLKHGNVEAAWIMSWLVRLYARKIGETKFIKMFKEELFK